MGNLGMPELMMILVLALLLFGPKKLPEIGKQVGKALGEFKRASNEFKAQIEQEIAHLEVEKPTILPPSPIPEGTASRSLTSSAAVESVATETPAAEIATSAAASNDEPLFASHISSSADGATPAVGEESSTTTTQESHA